MTEERESELARQMARLRAQLPLVDADIAIGGRTWRVTAVADQDALLERAGELEHFPFGFLLWEAAVGLARGLAAHPERVAGKRVLELGAGVGLPGLVAQSLGATVWQTDHQAGALTLARHNALQNGLASPAQFLADWRLWSDTRRYDVILGADIMYERSMRFYLEPIFHTNLTPGGVLLLSDPGRPQALEFAAQLETRGWHLEMNTLPVRLERLGQENRAVEVALFTVSR